MTPDDANAEPLKQLKEDIKTWECQTVEFKKTATSDHELAEAIAGFATSNAARIYIGIDDDGQTDRSGSASKQREYEILDRGNEPTE
jgi:predicted HTH transcriptional regulator